MRFRQALVFGVLTAVAATVALVPLPANASTQTPPQPASAQTVGAFKAWARARVGARQFRSLNKIWMHESGWNRYARNSSSGAYGIPQALPARKLGHAGSDWVWNGYTQMRWGLRYIESRYGSPAIAWRFWQAHYWY